MKTKIPHLLVALLLVLFISCNKEDDGKLWDFAPLNIEITVSDKNGNDLLDPNKEYSICKNGIKAIYEGEEYELIYKPSRYYLPTFYGLRLMQTTDGHYMLSFGEFDRTENYESLNVSIDWNDGSAKENITLKHTFNMTKDNPEFKTFILYNGQPAGEGST